VSGPEPIWVTVATALAVHDEQLAEHGGAPGVRDVGLLESALARPRNAYQHGERSYAAMAASLAAGIARNHPFIDGNKRVSLVLMELFLALNGLELVATDEDCVVIMLALASGEVAGDELADWLAARIR
jgi:death on curing protein